MKKMGSIGEGYTNSQTTGHVTGNDHGYPRAPLKQSGLLNERFESDDLTPVIGREFPKVNIVDDLLNAPDADTLLRDLAITSKIPIPQPLYPISTTPFTNNQN